MWRWRNALAPVFGVLLAFGVMAAERLPLIVTTPDGVVHLKVEVADTPGKRARGLMGREDLPSAQGMLFVFDGEGARSFWMKNTPLSLDILFFDGQGRWVNSHLGTRPHSVKSLKSAAPAQYVLELKAGEAERLGLGAGARLALPLAPS